MDKDCAKSDIYENHKVPLAEQERAQQGTEANTKSNRPVSLKDKLARERDFHWHMARQLDEVLMMLTPEMEHLMDLQKKLISLGYF